MNFNSDFNMGPISMFFNPQIHAFCFGWHHFAIVLFYFCYSFESFYFSKLDYLKNTLEDTFIGNSFIVNT